jgi:hypothetical protein
VSFAISDHVVANGDVTNKVTATFRRFAAAPVLLFFVNTIFSKENSDENLFPLVCLRYFVLYRLRRCAGTGHELKDLCLVTMTVTDGQQAIEGVVVSLSAKTSRGAWASRGITNAKGIAVIQTSRASYTGKGASAGDYKVTFVKMVIFPLMIVILPWLNAFPPLFHVVFSSLAGVLY